MVLWAPCPDPDKLFSSFVWGRKSEIGSRKSEVGNRKAEGGRRKVKIGNRKAERERRPPDGSMFNESDVPRWRGCHRELPKAIPCDGGGPQMLVPSSAPNARFGRWKLEGGKRKWEIGSGKSEGGSRKSEGGSGKWEIGRRKLK